ncbi:GNAT family N-acetyltransferase [Cereibacter sphaeroides f. sp. denitrificans]|nr:N-acetyltransferase [Cereibacter sphaeroides f. sp. denitrificans]
MSLPFEIPVLRTDRLILRGPRESDLPAMIAFGESDRTRFIGGRQDSFGTWRIFLAGIGHWALRGYGMWSVDTHEGAFVGRVGVINHIGWPEPELGWHLYEGHEGKGYAREAALAVRDHMQVRLGMGPLISMIDAENSRSLSLVRRLGAKLERAFEEGGRLIHIYRHPSDEDGGIEAYA